MKIFVSMTKNAMATGTFFDEKARRYIEEKHEVSYYPFEERKSIKEIIEMAKDSDVIITGWGHPLITYDDIKDTNIKIIAHTGGTVANVADISLWENGIKVLSANNLFSESVAEGTIGYMLMGLRHTYKHINAVKNGLWWTETPPLLNGLLEKTVGIIGLGGIARSLIKMLKVFRVNIKIYAEYEVDKEYLRENNAEQVSLEEVFSGCDVVSVHCAMNEETEGLIGKEHFDLLCDGALFVNTARGGIIREDEMIEALKENRFYAVLDVFRKEPLDIESELRTLPNVYPVPHLGGPTIDRHSGITKALADDIERFDKGEEMELEIKVDAAKRMTKGA